MKDDEAQSLSRWPSWIWINVWLGLCYYGPKLIPNRKPIILEPTLWDRAIPFVPETAWIYQSLFLLLPLTYFSLSDQNQIRQFTLGFTSLVTIFALMFWMYPTEIVRPTVEEQQRSNIYQYLILNVDGPENAFPSLHAALTAFLGYNLHQRVKHVSYSHTFRTALLLWIMVLLFATLATKQHLWIDILVGAPAGFITAYIWMNPNCIFAFRNSDVR
jgi:membrane-associated phospholipid phosphatase